MSIQSLKFGILAVLITATSLSSCKKDTSTEQELVTTVVVHLIASDGSLNQEFEWNDLDGPGGTAPTVDNILLSSGKTYSCHVHVYDRSKTPEIDVTTEIEAENTKHLLVFTTDGVNVTIVPTDTDDNGQAFRLDTNWTAGALSVGTVTITLKHEPDKNAADPDSTGETDFEVSFPVRIL